MTIWADDNFFKPRWGFAWYPEYDKLGHFICHYFATHLMNMWLQALDQDVVTIFGIKVFVVALWFSIGAAYEFMWDVPRGRKASWKDMVANLTGNILGVLI